MRAHQHKRHQTIIPRFPRKMRRGSIGFSLWNTVAVPLSLGVFKHSHRRWLIRLILKIKDLMTRNLISVVAEATVMQAAELMNEKGVSSVLVEHGGEFQGILTDRDIIAKIVSKGLDPKQVRVSDVMSSPLVTINGEQTIEEAAQRMREKGIRRLVVESKNAKVGVIAESDIIRVDPELHFLIREQSKLEAKPTPREPGRVALAGFCEECENYSASLLNLNGVWLCEDCRE